MCAEVMLNIVLGHHMKRMLPKGLVRVILDVFLIRYALLIVVREHTPSDPEISCDLQKKLDTRSHPIGHATHACTFEVDTEVLGDFLEERYLRFTLTEQPAPREK